MAGLTMSYDAPQGFTAPTAYVRIYKFCGDSLRGRLEFNVGIWYSFDAFTSDSPNLREIKYTIPFTDGMTLSDAYLWLQTRGEFQASTLIP